MEPVIFLEKVRRPGPRGLVRDRLDAATAMVRTGTPGPLTSALVLGPPGSGKTTLLSQLAAREPAVGWYRAGREDDAATVTRYLGHALATALQDPGLAAAASGGAIGDLIRELDETGPRPAMLFVDDLQELAGTPAERTLETLLAMRPREITIVLGSRRAPSMNTSPTRPSSSIRKAGACSASTMASGRASARWAISAPSPARISSSARARCACRRWRWAA